jgi:hypothetical protein
MLKVSSSIQIRKRRGSTCKALGFMLIPHRAGIVIVVVACLAALTALTGCTTVPTEKKSLGLTSIQSNLTCSAELSAAINRYARPRVVAVEVTQPAPVYAAPLSKAPAVTQARLTKAPPLNARYAATATPKSTVHAESAIDNFVDFKGASQSSGWNDDDAMGSPRTIEELGAEVTVDAGFFLLAAFVDAAHQKALRDKWAPLAPVLKNEIATFDLPQQLSASLRETLVPPTSVVSRDTNAATGLVLRIKLYRAGIQAVYPRYILEIAVRLSLVDTNSDDVVWEQGFRCTRPPARHSSETFVSAPWKAHPVESFAGDAGVQLLHQELIQAVDCLAREIARCFNAAGL